MKGAGGTGGAATGARARRRFIVIWLSAILVNIVFQLLAARLIPAFPVARAALESVALALIIAPISAVGLLRPFALSIAARDRGVAGRASAEEALKETNDIFDLYLRNSPIYAYVKEVTPTESRVLRASENFRDMVGIPGSAMVGRTMAELFPAEFAAKMTADDWAVASGGGVLEMEEELNGRTYTTIKFPVEQGGRKLLAGYTLDITETKKVERALAESEQRYKTLHEGAGLGIGYYALDGRVISYNRVAAANMGRAPEDFTGKSIFDLFPRAEAELYFLRVRQAAVSAVPLTFEDSVPLPGGPRTFLSTFARILDADGKVSGVQIISQDITERTRAEEALRASERLVEGLLNAIPAGVFWKNRDLLFVGCNKTFARDAGYEDPKDLIGKSDYQMSWKDQAERYRENDREVIESGQEKLLIEEPHTSANGQTVTLLTSKVPLCDDSGQVSGVLGTFMDITEHRKAEEALRENEEKLRTSESKYRKLIESAPAAIYVVEDEKVVFANGNAQEMLGYSREELLGMPMERVNHPDDWAAALGRYRERALGRTLPKSLTRHVKKNGDPVWVECVGERIEWEGKPAVLYFASNVTDRQVYEQYLQRAQKLESLGVLAGGIAHDFNNILTGVFGFVDLARTEAKDEAVAQTLALAMESMQRAKALTRQLLTFSKGGAPVRKSVSLAGLVREACRFSLHGSSVGCAFSLPDDLWRCDVDRDQVAQVVQNLVINAQQAMPLGGTIEVSARNVPLQAGEHPSLKAGRYVELFITDHGTGIPPEMLPRIFDPFFTTKSKGHGLGLAISYSIVSRHEGAISVESDVGKGTTFHVHLPAGGGAVREPVEPVAPRHAGSGRVLVMDDEAAVLSVLCRMLRSVGYVPVGHGNGTDAVSCFRTETAAGRPFVAMILDLTIPGGMGGREVAAAVRAVDSSIALFVPSGYAGDPIVANPGEYGFTASLSKPFSMAELTETLERHMPKGAGGR
jgi:two-component system, cell cycle sensor histidine kinase and response regulator CckA